MRAIILCILALAAAIPAPRPALAQSPQLLAARTEAMAEATRIAATARTDARLAIGEAASIKALRAARVLAVPPTTSAGDVAALEAEAAARGRGETVEALATHHRTRWVAYLAALAAIDGRAAAAREAIRTAGDTATVAAALDALRVGCASAVGGIPAELPAP
jgi:hypothetical protein